MPPPPTDTTADVEAPDVGGATTIALSGQSATATGTGAEVTDGMVTITAGRHLCGHSATMTEGARPCKCPPKREADPWCCSGMPAISCSTGSPLYVYKSKATTLTLPAGKGTASTLTPIGTDSTFSATATFGGRGCFSNACLYSKSDLIIAGSSLTVNAN